jgi:hypothetical protein
MNISPDGVTVRFNTEPYELFEAEKSGAKPNTVRILDLNEYHQLRQANPQKIIIQHKQEIFLRTITHSYVTDIIFGKVIVVISWINEKHHHPILRETEHSPGDHTMSLDPADVLLRNDEKATTAVKIEVEGAAPLQMQAINISSSLLKLVDKYSGEKTYDEFIRTLLANWCVPPHQHPPAWTIPVGPEGEDTEE